MAFNQNKLLDNVGWEILATLQENARLSFAELGRRVGLSLPAVAERVRRMEEAGVITGYRAQVNAKKIGLPITAFVRLSVRGDQYPEVIALARTMPEVRECHHLTGADSFIMKVVAASIPHLESMITRLSSYGQTTTSIVLSSPFTEQMFTRETTNQPGDSE
jgi:Lrp/AsnC family leucine-responsive transcriptional regulator